MNRPPPVRTRRLHVLRKHVDNEPQPEPMWMPREGLPAGGRAECRNGERPCPYIKCEHHLWMVAGRDRPGRRWNGKELPTTLVPRWLEYPTPPCCELDILELKRERILPLRLVAHAIGKTEDWTGDLLARALRKFSELEELGFDIPARLKRKLEAARARKLK